jgi:methylase of polypeptide subunit release factors
VAASDVEALAADLAGYDVDAVTALLGPVAAGALHREEPAAALAVTARVAGAGGDPLAALIRAFLLGARVSRRALAAAVPRTGVDGLERLGLVMAAGGGRDDEVVAMVDLRPVELSDDAGARTWWVASDLGASVTGAPLHPEHVLGVGGATLTLAGLTVRDHRARTLDLGTGSGIQALQATRHSDHVVATDVSERALAFARFNAALAGVDVDLRAGSLLEPVRGEVFDLVVSNPPFVITPRTAGADLPVYTYRDGRLVGDALVAGLVGGLGGVLAPGGVAQLLGNWEHRAGEAWTDRVGAWLDASGLDGWVVQREVLDAAEYAELWLRDGGAVRAQDPAGWDAAVGQWLADFDARGVQAVGLGLVVLRRPAGAPTLRRLEARMDPAPGPLGPHLAAALAAHDWLTARDDAALLGERLVVAGDVTEERHLRPGDPGPRVVLLRQGGGFDRAVQAGTALAGLVGACDGDLSVGQLLGGLGAVLEVPVDDLRAELVPQVRELVADGFLVPA